MTVSSGLAEMFGEANIDAFKQLALFARTGHVLDHEGKDVYLPNIRRLALPITFIHGSENACFRPLSTERTLARLSEANGRQLYERHVIPGYGHIDCIFGKHAARDVYPLIVAHFDKTARALRSASGRASRAARANISRKCALVKLGARSQSLGFRLALAIRRLRLRGLIAAMTSGDRSSPPVAI